MEIPRSIPCLRYATVSSDTGYFGSELKSELMLAGDTDGYTENWLFSFPATHTNADPWDRVGAHSSWRCGNFSRGLNAACESAHLICLIQLLLLNMTPLCAQISRTRDVLEGLACTIAEQERLVSVLRQEGRPTEHAERLLASFRETQSAVVAYKDELEGRLREEQLSSESREGKAQHETISVKYL